MRVPDSQIDRLLSGKDQLSPAEKERVLERVLARVAAAEPRPVRAWLRPARWAVAAALLVAVGVAGWRSWRGPSVLEFQVRGGAGEAPALRLRCTGEENHPGSCRRGEKLLFEVTPGRFRAFAAVALAPDGTTFWYFPNDLTPRSVQLDRAGRSGLLDQTILLDDRHADGGYTIYGVFSRQPLSREEVRQAIRQPPGDMVVVQQALRIGEPAP